MARLLGRWGLTLTRGPVVQRRVLSQERPDRRSIELLTAVQILQEVFGTTSEEIEEMIRLRLIEHARHEDEGI